MVYYLFDSRDRLISLTLFSGVGALNCRPIKWFLMISESAGSAEDIGGVRSRQVSDNVNSKKGISASGPRI
ncbi:hypothetical protein L6452_30696 [Arctium lappa]|uniref:Uncharacterized protein n=1 Tax=Arctium lappa TaxID=4217 RepID=A0ACB8ZJ98_ARCLA|nr:hypothetical protein L6452_30696 [Arctium lappa]